VPAGGHAVPRATCRPHGGDCTVTIGLVAGHARTGTAPALLYVDGGPDLYTPTTRANGNLDATGLAHLLALRGALPALAAAGPTVPLLRRAHGPFVRPGALPMARWQRRV
jgi:hypothetical protein